MPHVGVVDVTHEVSKQAADQLQTRCQFITDLGIVDVDGKLLARLGRGVDAVLSISMEKSRQSMRRSSSSFSTRRAISRSSSARSHDALTDPTPSPVSLYLGTVPPS